MNIYTDGACKGNPGPAGYGCAFYDQDMLILAMYGYIGKSTNNIAEYSAIKFALQEAIRRNYLSVIIYSDSNLAVQQLNGKWKVKNKNIQQIFAEVKALLDKLDKWQIKHVKAHCGIEGNEKADELANTAIETKGSDINDAYI